MSEPSCNTPSPNASDFTELPTRQKNALRLLLGKAAITPEEVARLDGRAIERAPGVGTNSLRIIQYWLAAHGYTLSGPPDSTINKRLVQRQRKLERAIDYLRENGYDVHGPD